MFVRLFMFELFDIIHSFSLVSMTDVIVLNVDLFYY